MSLSSLSASNRRTNTLSKWSWATILVAFIFFGVSVRWSFIDNRPPAWDPGLYLYQATILHESFMQNGFVDFLVAVFNVDRGRVPLLPVMVQPAFLLFGPSLDAAVISLNFAWFILAWSLAGITREVAGANSKDRAAFFAFVLFGFYPLTMMLSHNYLVELLLVTLVCAAMYSLLLLHKTKETKWSILAGICIGFGLLTKITFPAFVLPAFGILFFRNVRDSSVRTAVGLFLPVMSLAVIIAGPYYLYNLKQIFELTTLLSSHNLSQMYGFGGAFDFRTILNYLLDVLANPAIYVGVFCVLATLFFQRSWSADSSGEILEYRKNKTFIIVMIVWFAIPFLLAMFGEIKEPRYAYPGMVPLFVLAGIAAARNFESRMGAILMVVAYVILLPGYLYSNNLISAKSAKLFLSPVEVGSDLATDIAPDQRDWKVGELVQEISDAFAPHQGNRSILFLGGNRNYHLRLLDYYGLIANIHLRYFPLPYYSNPSMTIDQAMAFIDDTSPAGIIYKSGENWPAFSSRLDSAIIPQLKANSKYVAKELDTEQPDGSRFTLFVKRQPSYLSVISVSELIGHWRVGGGVADIAASDGRGLAITTETGLKGFAVIKDGVVYVDEWKVSGRITSDLKSVHWSNGFIWNKLPSGNLSSGVIKTPSN